MRLMLSKIATAGTNGQFRTPRHIIELLVAMRNPQPMEAICDPASVFAVFSWPPANTSETTTRN